MLAVPVTPKTRHLMNAERLAHLKPDAYLINVGRGVLIDEGAMVQALEARSFAGAALDVTSEEPLPVESPPGVWRMFSLRLISRGLRNECGNATTRITPKTCAVTWRVSRCCGWWTNSVDIDRYCLRGKVLSYWYKLKGTCLL